MDIKHVVVLMLENRSFDCMLGKLYPASAEFDGLTGEEANTWHRDDGQSEVIAVWTDPTLTPQTACIPDPDPGELFKDIDMQLRGLRNSGEPSSRPVNMSGFVDNYMRQPATNPSAAPASIMHYFSPEHVPVISQLARSFGVSDRWHASAPCQTWPNRFFAHTATADGYINNSPPHFPYRMETVFNRLSDAGQSWRVYYHDMPQSATLARIWDDMATNFCHYTEHFEQDAKNGTLPAYSFIEPRYFTDSLLKLIPSDQHPPHNVAYGEQLMANVYNAVRGGPAWKNTLLIITYDEHGGCYDHVVPPPATPPGGPTPDGYDFGSFGVRVPAVIVSPHIRPSSVIRPRGGTPFDHTSIIATLRRLFNFPPLTPRDAAAPDLIEFLDEGVDNDGPSSITAPAIPPTTAQIASLNAQIPNDLQKSLNLLAQHLPTAGSDIAAHIAQLATTPVQVIEHATVGEMAAEAIGRFKAFFET